jgi:hypothetical protein
MAVVAEGKQASRELRWSVRRKTDAVMRLLRGEDLLEELRVALLRASEEKAVEKLKQVLACVVDPIVVEGRDHIQPYYLVPGVLTVFPSRRRREHCKNPSAAGQGVWVSAREWGRVA